MSKPCITYRISIDGYTHLCSHPVGTPIEDVIDAEFGGDPRARFIDYEWESFAWPGGYEIHYHTADGGVLCHNCANEERERTLDPEDDQFLIVAADINYEQADVYCDHCNRRIEPAYGDDA